MKSNLKIKQVLINLINNANKFTENGLIKLKIIKKHDFGEMISLEFQVIDNGIGIPIQFSSNLIIFYYLHFYFVYFIFKISFYILK